MYSYSKIRSGIETIENDTSLYEEKIFDKRIEVIDFIEYQLIDRIDALLQKTAHPDELILLKHRAEKVKSELEEIEKICGMIMATRIPQSPKTHLEQILADADLDYLGRDDFYTIGDKMYKELGLGHRDEWNEMQLKFLERHTYFTQTALALRDAKKKKHLDQIREQLP